MSRIQQIARNLLLILIFFSIFTIGANVVIAQDIFSTSKDALFIAGKDQKVVKRMKALLTAYSSTPDQTDDSPFITASGSTVKPGIVANNLLPFGTRIKIPKLYGNKVFIVEDRMHRRKSKNQFDLWMGDRYAAVNFGVKIAEIEILEN